MSRVSSSDWRGSRPARGLSYFRHDLADFSEVATPPDPAARKKVLNDAAPDVVPHFFKLLVHFGIVLVVLDELHHERAVCQRKELGILRSGGERVSAGRCGVGDLLFCQCGPSIDLRRWPCAA